MTCSWSMFYLPEKHQGLFQFSGASGRRVSPWPSPVPSIPQLAPRHKPPQGISRGDGCTTEDLLINRISDTAELTVGTPTRGDIFPLRSHIRLQKCSQSISPSAWHSTSLRSAAVESEAVRCQVTESYKSLLRSGVYSGFSRFKDIESSRRGKKKGVNVMNFTGEKRLCVNLFNRRRLGGNQRLWIKLLKSTNMRWRTAQGRAAALVLSNLFFSQRLKLQNVAISLNEMILVFT